MIVGTVNANREAVISIHVTGQNGQRETIEAIIDTGFSGDLTLPGTLIDALGLIWLGRESGVLADGSTDLFDVYSGEVIWNGQPRRIEIEDANTEPLLGMNNEIGRIHGHTSQQFNSSTGKSRYEQ